MKKISIVILFFVFAIYINAQEFKKGDKIVNAGIGLGYTYSTSYGLGVTTIPAFSLSGEMGVYQLQEIGVISAGGIIAVQHFSAKYSGGTLSYNDMFFGARGIFHLNTLKVQNLDVFGGLSLGLRLRSYPNYVSTSPISGYWDTNVSSEQYVGLFVGARYYFLPNNAPQLAAFSEVGLDVSFIKIGISYNL